MHESSSINWLLGKWMKQCSSGHVLRTPRLDSHTVASPYHKVWSGSKDAQNRVLNFFNGFFFCLFQSVFQTSKSSYKGWFTKLRAPSEFLQASGANTHLRVSPEPSQDPTKTQKQALLFEFTPGMWTLYIQMYPLRSVKSQPLRFTPLGGEPDSNQYWKCKYYIRNSTLSCNQLLAQ